MRSAKDRIMEERKIDRRREREEEGERERQVKSCRKKNDYIISCLEDIVVPTNSCGAHV